MSPSRVIVEADGGSRGNPGPAGYGAVVRDADTGQILMERKQFIGTGTNNVAEYRGLIAGLQAAADLGAAQVAVRMDSKLVVEQMSGRWQVKNETMRKLVREAHELRGRFAAVTFEWIPRERNKDADRLANDAMDAGTQRPTRPAAGVVSPSWAPPTGVRTRLVLVRHGTTKHNAELRFSGRNDLPLTDVGARQAAAIAAAIPAFGAATVIVSSPLIRARQTAEHIGSALGRDIREDDRLAEMDFGAWEGLTLDDVQRSWPAELAAWLADPHTAPPGGESFADVERRVADARDAILREYPDATVILVTHVTPIKTLLRLALGAPAATMFRMHLDTASISVADYYVAGQTSVRLVNDTSHLRPR
jgi:ribonuclease H / adenosylcobalamin/alpha-ribazole phosphatase